MKIKNPLALHKIGRRKNQEDNIFPQGIDLRNCSKTT